MYTHTAAITQCADCCGGVGAAAYMLAWIAAGGIIISASYHAHQMDGVSIGYMHASMRCGAGLQRGCACAGMVRVAVRGGRAGGTQG